MADEIGVNIILAVGDRKIEITESEARAIHKKLSEIFKGISPLWPNNFPQVPHIPTVTSRNDLLGRYDVETVGLGQSRGEAIGVSICGGPDDPRSTHTCS